MHNKNGGLTAVCYKYLTSMYVHMSKLEDF